MMKAVIAAAASITPMMRISCVASARDGGSGRFHEEEGIRDFEGCVRCHRSAEDEPGERGEGRREHGGDDD